MPDGESGTVSLTYAELARARGISKASAERLVHNHKWRRSRGNDGRVRVMVPPDFVPEISPEIRADRRGRPGRPSKTRITPEISPENSPEITPDFRGMIEAALAPIRELADSERIRAERAESRIDAERDRADRAEKRVGEEWARAARERARAESAEQRIKKLEAELDQARRRRSWWPWRRA